MPPRPTLAVTILAFVSSIILVALVAGVGSMFPPGPWYDQLVKPPFNPPDWIFGPVWTTLYLAMAIAAVLVWRQWPRREAQRGLLLYGVTLVLNGAWTPLFFGAHQLGLALVVVVLLDVFIVAAAYNFWRVSRTASLLMVPYALWVSFAAFLNASLWYLNPQG